MSATQRVTMELDIGSGYVCTPCTMARFGVCKRFGVRLKMDEFTGLSKEYPGEELSYEMRCDECLAKWPVKETGG